MPESKDVYEHPFPCPRCGKGSLKRDGAKLVCNNPKGDKKSPFKEPCGYKTDGFQPSLSPPELYKSIYPYQF